MAIAIHSELELGNTVLTHISDELDCWLIDHDDCLLDDVRAGFDSQKGVLKQHVTNILGEAFENDQ